MYWFNVLVIAPLWGMLSAQLFSQGCLGLINFPVAIFGHFKKVVPPEMSLAAVTASGGMAVIFFIMLSAGIYVIRNYTSFGRTLSENIVFWVFFVFSLWFMANQIIVKITTNWRHCTVPGTWERERG